MGAATREESGALKPEAAERRLSIGLGGADLEVCRRLTTYRDPSPTTSARDAGAMSHGGGIQERIPSRPGSTPASPGVQERIGALRIGGHVMRSTFCSMAVSCPERRYGARM